MKFLFVIKKTTVCDRVGGQGSCLSRNLKVRRWFATVQACRQTPINWWSDWPITGFIMWAVCHPSLSIVSVVWAQTPGRDGSQLWHSAWAHETELSPCGRGGQTHSPVGARGSGWPLPAWRRRSHGQRWVLNGWWFTLWKTSSDSPWILFLVTIEFLQKRECVLEPAIEPMRLACGRDRNCRFHDLSVYWC